MGDYFFADFCNGWIRSYDRTAQVASGFLTGASLIVDLEVGTDGTLYYLSRGAPATLHAVEYTPSQGGRRDADRPCRAVPRRYGVGSANAAPKVSEFPKVGGHTVATAGAEIGAPSTND